MATKALSPEWAEFFDIPPNYTTNYASAASPTAKLSLSAAPTSIAQGGSTAMTASVTYPNGSAASRVAVNFPSGGKEVGSAVTGTNGQAALAYTPTAAGTYSLTADLASAPSVASNAVCLTVTSNVTPTPPPTPTPTSSNAMLYAVVVVAVIVLVAALLALTRGARRASSQQLTSETK